MVHATPQTEFTANAAIVLVTTKVAHNYVTGYSVEVFAMMVRLGEEKSTTKRCAQAREKHGLETTSGTPQPNLSAQQEKTANLQECAL